MVLIPPFLIYVLHIHHNDHRRNTHREFRVLLAGRNIHTILFLAYFPLGNQGNMGMPH